MREKIEKYLAVVIVLGVFMPAFIPIASALDPVMSVESPQAVYCGRDFTVNITVEPRANEIFSAEYTLYFDTGILDALTQTNATFLSWDGTETIVAPNSIDNPNGKTEYGETRAGFPEEVGGVLNPGVLATITFVATTPGTSDLNLGMAKLVKWDNDQLEKISALTLNGTVEAKPPEPFNVSGYVIYENGGACNNPVVVVTNLNTSEVWAAETSATSNYYRLDLGSGSDVVAGEVLQFNATSPDGSMFSTTSHTVTTEEVEEEGIFNFNLTVGLPKNPDLIISDVWVNWPVNCTIYYNITNMGNEKAPAGHKTSLSVDFSEVTLETVPIELEPGESHIGCFKSYTWTYTPPKDDILVCADRDAMVQESDEDNNCASTKWKCGDPTENGFVDTTDVTAIWNYYTIGTFLKNKWAADAAPTYGVVDTSDIMAIWNRYVTGSELSCTCSG